MDYINKTISVFDLPAMEKIGEHSECVDWGLLGKHCLEHIPDYKAGTKRHELNCVISGPDDESLRQSANACFQSAAVQTALATIMSCFTPAALPALPAAITAFILAFTGCMQGRTDISFSFPHTEHWL